MSLSFSIIIVTWNAAEHLRTFLPSVTKTRHPDYEILIADNGSTDDSREWVQTHHPECRIIQLDRNYGYCGGNNRAAAHAEGEILLFLNNDVEVDPDWLNQLERAFDDPRTAVVQPKIRSWRERDHFEYAGAGGGYLDSMAYPFCRGRLFDTVEHDQGQYDDPTDIFWASGAAFAIRKELFREAGGFDEAFEFHMEEIDLCWYLLNRGYRVRVSPSSVVYHLGGGSLPMGSSRKTYYNFRNSLMTIWKHASSSWLWKRFFLRLCLDGVAGVYAALKGNFGDLLAIIRAHFHFYSRWGEVHRKRHQLEKSRTVRHEPAVMSRNLVIADYFLRGKRRFRDLNLTWWRESIGSENPEISGERRR